MSRSLNILFIFVACSYEFFRRKFYFVLQSSHCFSFSSYIMCVRQMCVKMNLSSSIVRFLIVLKTLLCDCFIADLMEHNLSVCRRFSYKFEFHRLSNCTSTCCNQASSVFLGDTGSLGCLDLTRKYKEYFHH